MENQKVVIDVLSKMFESRPETCSWFIRKGADLLVDSNWEISNVLSSALEVMIKSGNENGNDGIRIIIPITVMLDRAARYASAMEDPDSFSWEEFLTSGFLNKD